MKYEGRTPKYEIVSFARYCAPNMRTRASEGGIKGRFMLWVFIFSALYTYKNNVNINATHYATPPGFAYILCN